MTHGSSEISQKGSEVSGNDPYLVKNGRFQELVITQPEQLREFSRKDAKGMCIFFYWFSLVARCCFSDSIPRPYETEEYESRRLFWPVGTVLFFFL